jgi:YegS/Rv2252/BmrU family lipid kinase
MRAALVVNPLAGGRRGEPFDAGRVQKIIATAAAAAGVSATAYVTQLPGGGRTSAREALDTGPDLVVAWGGDGTVNEVAGVLAGSEIPLGLVPAGSGNGLARELGIPLDSAPALDIAFRRRTRAIDVGMAGARAFVNVAGFGFDAHVAHRFNAGGESRGFRRYVWLTLREILSYPSQSYEVRWDGGSFEGEALIVAFANSRQYGNGACVAPDASLDDGILDLVLVRPTMPWRDLWRARQLFTRGILNDSGVTFARVTQATIASEAGLQYHIDGEPMPGAASLDMRVRPRALRVCVP